MLTGFMSALDRGAGRGQSGWRAVVSTISHVGVLVRRLLVVADRGIGTGVNVADRNSRDHDASHPAGLSRDITQMSPAIEGRLVKSAHPEGVPDAQRPRKLICRLTKPIDGRL